MRIERIELDGFGRFAGAAWDLQPGLSVLLGPNEAGKTTLLNAIRALLFGFESTREGRAWYPALAGGRRGGRLSLVTAGGERWTVERHGERGGTGSLTVRAPSGNVGGQETLDRLLAGVDRELFTSVFAFGLSELQSISSLSGEGVRSRIYGAGSGLGGMSAADLERGLRARQESIFRPRGRDQELNRAVARIDELRTRIAELERQPVRYEELHRELAALAAERAAVDDERRLAEEQAARAAQLADAREPAALLSAIDAELAAGDAALDALPPQLEARLGEVRAEREAAVEALAAADRALEARRRRLAELAVDEQLLAAADEIAALVEERPLDAARDAVLADAEAARAAAEAELADLARRGGGEATWLAGLDDSIAAIEATREAGMRLAAAEQRVARAEARLESLTDGDPLASLDPALLAERRAALRALGELRVRAAVAAAGGGGRERRILVAATPVLVALAVGIAAAAMNAPWGLPVALAIGLVIAATAWRASGPRGQPDLEAERQRLLALAGLAADAEDAAVDEAADAAAAEWAAWQAARRRGSGGEARAAAHRERAEAEAALAAERRAWGAWLVERGLPATASPEAARQVLGLATAARRAAAARAAAAERLAGTSEARQRFFARVDRLHERLGWPRADAASRGAAVIVLGERLAAARAAADRCRELNEEIETAARERAPLEARATAAQVALDTLLAAHGAQDLEQLRARAAAAAARRELHARRREIRARLAGIAGGEARLEDLLRSAAASDPATVTVDRDEARRRVAELEARGHELSTRAGELRAELATLEHAGELGDRRQELSALEGRVAALAREWTVRAVALRLLEETRQRYERERQPRVVQDASGYFERITAGAYERIVAAPGEATVRVEAATGSPRLTDELSRGTAEQLYLALRFGLIEQFARASEPLPVVMDDILVNFDADRAARAAAAVRQLAERHQVLYFTCHPWTAELLDPSAAGTHTLD